jgi:SAM-dependent methyltransferase
VSEEARRRWDRRYEPPHCIFGRAPHRLLLEHSSLLPGSGLALDLAAGEGQNAVYLASLGHAVRAVDISPLGLRKARRLAREQGVVLETIVQDLELEPPPPGPYTVIVWMHYLQRDLARPVAQRLAPGGLLLMELATVHNLRLKRRPARRFLVQPGELRGWFPDLQLVLYREGVYGQRAVAQLVARKCK